MSNKIATIKETGTGEVYTGKVVSTGPSNGDVALALFTGGLSVPFTDTSKVTVRVNGEKHTGHRVK
ncbi:MAG: hypothetical protein K2Y71_15585 [Xanthobacteraceae bacterium]|nr:hypothetical protein [Xanthobacteraceae bacterium]